MEEVKRQGLLQGSTRPPKEPSLQQGATDCLVLEHLQASGYEYSASVFVPESAQSEAKLSAGDALRALQIPPHALRGEKENDGEGAASSGSSLVRALAALEQARANAASDAPQAADAPAAQSLERRLQLVDASHEHARGVRQAPLVAAEEHLLRFQREADARGSALQAEVHRLREVGSTRSAPRARRGPRRGGPPQPHTKPGPSPRPRPRRPHPNPLPPHPHPNPTPPTLPPPPSPPPTHTSPPHPKPKSPSASPAPAPLARWSVWSRSRGSGTRAARQAAGA